MPKPVLPGGRVIYIAGRMHCGSTFLDVLLGSCPDAASLGELVTGLSRGADEKCGCGQTLRECPFWSSVKRSYEQGQRRGLFEDATWLHVRSDVRRFFSALFVNLDARQPAQSEWRTFSELNRRMIQAVIEASERAVVIDSNKEFTRGVMTLRADPTARLIHLTRDPVATVGSYYWRQTQGSPFYFMKRSYNIKWMRFPALMLVALSWNVGILLGILMHWKYPRRVLHVSYERFCEDPAAELRRIGSFAQLDVATVIDGIAAGRAFPLAHNLAGNAELKADGAFTFVANKGGRRRLPVSYRVGARLLTLPGRILRALFIDEG